MGVWDIEPSEDWFRRFFSGIPFFPRTGGSWDRLSYMPRQFDEMRREMQRMFEEELKDIQSKIPKELVREYETPQGGKVREVGPLVYGYSMTIGPDGKPKVREFGNVKPSSGGVFGGGMTRPEISREIEPL